MPEFLIGKRKVGFSTHGHAIVSQDRMCQIQNMVCRFNFGAFGGSKKNPAVINCRILLCRTLASYSESESSVPVSAAESAAAGSESPAATPTGSSGSSGAGGST